MTKRLLFGVSFGCVSLLAGALPITPEKALERMASAMPTRSHEGGMSLCYTVNASDGVPSLYVFTRSSDAGYVFLSADDDAYPVLGYADNGTFDAENLSPALEWWLSGYARQIEYARRNAGVAGDTNRDFSTRGMVYGTAVVPMLDTKWNQGSPYNEQCPRVNGARSVTGCVATAMAQVMYYHRYPERGMGEVSLSQTNIDSDDPTTLDLSLEAFDWNNMLPSYDGDYTDEQSAAVAYLMKACGYSVNMKYSPSESGAISFNIGKALIENFGYNKGLTYEERMYYNESSWGQMVYDELSSGRPVIYGGRSEGGGHQFVCDGYDGNGYFHINWGWGGISDGYFLLQSLNPYDLGIGGGTGGGFSYDQSIIKGVSPKDQTTSSFRILQEGNLAGNKSSTAKIQLRLSEDKAGWWNMSYGEVNISFGVIVEGLDGVNVPKTPVVGTISDQSLANVSVGSMRGFTSFDFLFPTSFPDGRYRVTVAYRNLDDRNSEWTPVFCPERYSNSVVVTKSGTRYTLDFSPAKTLTLSGGGLESPLYYGSYVKVRMELKNETDVELSQTIAPALMRQGVNQFVGTGVPVNLKPGESLVKEIVTYLEPQEGVTAVTVPTSFSLKFVNLDEGSNYKFSESVTMLPAIPYSVSCVGIDIAGASKESRPGYDIFWIADPSEMEVAAEIRCDKGYFAQPVYALIFPNKEGAYNLTSNILTPVALLSEGESCRVGTTIYFEQGIEGGEYILSLYEEKQGKLNSLGVDCLLVVGSSGVEEVGIKSGLSVVYDRQSANVVVESDSHVMSVMVSSLSGKTEELRISENAGGVSASVAHLPKGIYIVTATDKSGVTKSLKIVR